MNTNTPYKKSLSILLAAALLGVSLGGCGMAEDTEETSASNTTFESVTGVAPDAVVMTVNGEEVTALELGYWLAYSVEQYTYYYGEDIDWDSTASEDSEDTYADLVRSNAADIAMNYVLLSQQAEALELSLDEEELAEVEEELDGFVTSFGEDRWEEAVENGEVSEDDYTDEEKVDWIEEQGQEAYQQELERYCSDEAHLRELKQITVLYNKLQEAYYGEDGLEPLSDETLSAYAEENGYLCSRSILFSTIEDEDGNSVDFADMTDEQKASLKQEAQETLDSILAAEDPETEFNSQMVSNNDDSGLSEESDVYLYPSGTMVDEYESAVEALEENQIGTELVESEDYGYFIIMRLPVDYDTETVTSDGSSIRSLCSAESFQTLMEQWAEEAEVETTEEFEQLSIGGVAENLQEE